MNKHIVAKNFKHRQPTPEQVEKIEALNNSARIMALVVLSNTPGSAEQTTAIRKIEEATMWATTALLREEPKPSETPEPAAATTEA